MNGQLAITWFHHRRMEGLCAGLGIELHTLVSPHGRVRRYLELMRRTLQLLAKKRPQVLLVQNPSLVLTTLALLVRPWFGYRLVVDAHNEAVEPYIIKQGWYVWLTKRLLRRADLTIVTNRWLSGQVEAAGGRPFVLPDPIPAAVTTQGDGGWRSEGKLRVAAIATYAPDEPIGSLFEAARLLPDVEFAFTGNPQKLAAALLGRAPSNVRFTGFLPEDGYWSLLNTADAIVDLTLMDHCLVCGAYEAVAAGKPAILSGNAAARELFAQTALFTTEAPADIVAAFNELRAGALRPEQVAAAAHALRATWSRDVAALRELCGRLARPARS